MWYSTDTLAKQVEAVNVRTGNMPPEMAEEVLREEAERGWAKIEECVLQFKAGRNILSGGRFDTLSLGTWMEIVAAADLTYVPAELVHLASGTKIMASQFAPIKLDIPEELRKYRGVVRLDNCGSAALKVKMSMRGADERQHIVGAVEKGGDFYFVFDDRTVHGVMEYVGQIGPDGDAQHPIWWRPWVNAVQVDVPRPTFMGRAVDKWPLEWRVIVQGGEVAAVSAYYIQAPVSLNDQVASHIRSVIEQSEKLLAFMREKNIQPWHPRYIGERDESDVSFSFDMISTEHGPAFLEAGPAVPVDENNVPVAVWGAHPCFFMDKKVGGVALSKEKALPLSDFR